MLEPNEKAMFDSLVNGLRTNDPGFTRRIDRLARPKRNLYLVLAILLWTAAPICIVFGGWTGLFLALVGVAYGLHLMSKRGGITGAAVWPAPRRRPGVSN
ncbi:hypothetical protein GCM10010172_51580 [Paractinoplanes ferrugineus]|uniref:DUF3040 domain-containing protein n=1 Tax=Paractinoplanes ferrugineus TaxID=113564 RepID=A0A919J166_9ACTN|nr:DUF3040 domain-containing protein [Actinoplanes ferrugineus]GIE12023.1 hypothetical protein Afe05nite_38630 [Actinoplanes ferrugineus]